MERFEIHNNQNPLQVDLKFVLLKNIYATGAVLTVMNDLTPYTMIYTVKMLSGVDGTTKKYGVYAV